MTKQSLERRLKIAQKLVWGVILLLVINSFAAMLQGVLGYIIGISVIVMLIVGNLLLSNRFDLRNKHPALLTLIGALLVIIPMIEVGMKVFEAGSVQWAFVTSVLPVFVGSILPILSLVLVAYIIKNTIVHLAND